MWKTKGVATLLGESVGMKLTLPKLGPGSPPWLPKFQNSIAGVKTPCIGVFFISLKKYRSVDVENGLAWAIWTSATQVMAQKKVGSQIGKSGIDLTPVHVGGVQYTVGKLSRRATSLIETSSQSDVWAKSYDLAKFQESKPG